MPKQYEAMRDKFAAENRAKGLPPKEAYDQAQSKAAAIYNSRHRIKLVNMADKRK